MYMCNWGYNPLTNMVNLRYLTKHLFFKLVSAFYHYSKSKRLKFVSSRLTQLNMSTSNPNRHFPNFSHFPMIFLWFSYSFPWFFLWQILETGPQVPGLGRSSGAAETGAGAEGAGGPPSARHLGHAQAKPGRFLEVRYVMWDDPMDP